MKLTGPPGHKVVELLGYVLRAWGTVRETGERSEVSGIPKGAPSEVKSGTM